jgi:hypothetical protein
LWPLQPGAFPGARVLRACDSAPPARLRPPKHAQPRRTPPRSRADAATAAVLACLPSGAKRALRLCCRAGRAAVDAHARRLEVCQGRTLLGPAAAARMPLLQELELSANDDADVLALAAGLRAVAQGPAEPRRATVWAIGSGAALGGLVSALAALKALTRLELSIESEGSSARWAAGLVLPWARIEVGAAAGPRAEGCQAGRVTRSAR